MSRTPALLLLIAGIIGALVFGYWTFIAWALGWAGMGHGGPFVDDEWNRADWISLGAIVLFGALALVSLLVPILNWRRISRREDARWHETRDRLRQRSRE